MAYLVLSFLSFPLFFFSYISSRRRFNWDISIVTRDVHGVHKYFLQTSNILYVHSFATCCIVIKSCMTISRSYIMTLGSEINLRWEFLRQYTVWGIWDPHSDFAEDSDRLETWPSVFWSSSCRLLVGLQCLLLQGSSKILYSLATKDEGTAIHRNTKNYQLKRHRITSQKICFSMSSISVIWKYPVTISRKHVAHS